MMNKSKNRRVKTMRHLTHDNSIKGRYIFLNQKFDDADELMRKYIKINYIIYELYGIH